MSSNAGSPPALGASNTPVDVKPFVSHRPSLIMKPTQSPPTSSPAPQSASASMSLTSKEWVIPPRPKPGRKPATDTPPTKRKAQNRAAQRAFRERRAARVGELEEQIKQIEDEHEKEQDVLRADIARLEKEVEHYRTDLANWVDRCRRLETDLADMKARNRPSPDANQTAPSQPKSGNRNTAGDGNETAVGCGNCTLETRCQCIDDAFDAMNGEVHDVVQPEKRPHSPSQPSSEKRVKVEPKENLEIDFTAIYASKNSRITAHATQVSPTSAVADPCGFCSDGTPCICAEMAAEQEQAQSSSQVSRPSVSMDRSGINQLAQFTPPPSEGDVSISITATAPPASCADGPGTCAQCRADPNSTLFCKSLAASRSNAIPTGTPQGCCGGGSSGGVCCQSQPDSVPLPPRKTRSRAAGSAPTTRATQLPPPSKVGVTLTCADAYTTLSRHPAYERASGEIASWMPKLHASDTLRAGAAEGRPALDIDAANVMAVLKDFDRRFGQNR